MATDEGTGLASTGRSLTARDVDGAALGYLWGRYLPWWWMLVRGAILAFLYRTEIQATVTRTRQILDQLRRIEARDPALYQKVVATWRAELRSELPQRFSIEDPAFLVGRLLRAHDRDAEPGQMALVGAEVLAILLASHLPGALVVSLGKAAAAHAGELLRAELGVAADAAAQAGKEALAEQLRALQGAAEALRPGLDRVGALFGRAGQKAA